MKGFHFRLETILSLRRHREEVLQGELAECERHLDMERAELARIDDEIRQRTRGRRGGSGPVDVEMLSLEQGYVELLKRQRLQQSARVEEQAAVVQRAREDLLAASRDKKALETYKDKAIVAFSREASMKEQKGSEEMAGVLHLRKRQEPDDAD